MALTWTGEDEIETVATAWEATAAFTQDDPDAVIATLFGAIVEAMAQAQESGNTAVRWAEALVDSNGDNCAPVTAYMVMELATKAHIMRGEIGQVASGPTAQENEDAFEGDTYDVANLAPAH